MYDETKLLITGCPRSGTARLAYLLNLAGIPASHEGVFTPQGVCLEHYAGTVVDVSWLGAAYASDARHVIMYQMVRHPLAVATSLYNMEFFQSTGVHIQCVHLTLEKDYNGRRFPELDFWIDWNRLTQECTARWFRTEDVSVSLLEKLAAVAGMDISYTEDLRGQIKRNDINGGYASPSVDFDLENYDRLEELHCLASFFGYEL